MAHRSVNGVELWYRITGEGEPVFQIHGAGFGHYNFDPATPETSTTRGAAGSPSRTRASGPLGASKTSCSVPSGNTRQSMSGMARSLARASSIVVIARSDYPSGSPASSSWRGE